MKFAAAAALLPFALSATATPLVARQSDACANFGSSGQDTRGRFLLAAYNTTLPNSNHFGAPLTQASAGATGGLSLRKLSTWDSLPYEDSRRAFVLENGALQPEGTSPDVEVNGGATEGKTITWAQGSFVTGPSAQSWCSVATTLEIDAGVQVLAVNGDTDSFSICKGGDYDTATMDVVYRAKENSGYVFDTCYPVRIHVILNE